MNQTIPEKHIVSSAHLAEQAQELSELEFGLVIATNAFQRWMERCMHAAGEMELKSIDIQVLHNITSRNRSKRQGDICLLLNIEDAHTVAYALKKLLKLDLVEGVKQGKEMFYSTTEKGRALCLRYAEIRQQCLIESFKNLQADPDMLRHTASLLRTFSGLYDQAARAATSL